MRLRQRRAKWETRRSNSLVGGLMMSTNALSKVDLLSLLAIQQYGKKWRKVEECVGTRTGIQIRSHAQKYFNKLNKLQNGQKKEKQVSNVSSSKIESVSENELKGKSESDVRESKADEQKENRKEGAEEQPPNTAKEEPSNAAKENASGNANPLPEPQHTPSPHKFQQLKHKQERRAAVLGDKELYKELLRHAETVGSFRRVFETLKANSEADPLIDVELDQGRRILNVILYKVQEQFSIKRNMQQLYECRAKLIKEIEAIQTIITELLLKHSDEKHFKQLFDTL
eukprot:TRINITY_DN1541_c0_g2_i1.p1 TRINITY_DN1541_c0_g2~~TRINITY_DN1541_c0_g2_i1.p1  ORF type:complete len:285 (+),score=75.71 TRINITY_DN1541_c0_g2_i1:449-1303(+)